MGDHRYGLYEFESGSPWGSRIWFYQCAFAETKQNRCRLEKETVQKEIAAWMDVAVAYNESFAIKVARFGDNMRNVGVTEGDKVEAQIQFGWTVDYFGIGDLVQVIDAVTDEEINDLFEEYRNLYEFDQEIMKPQSGKHM